jgi:hypothetical protein
MGPTGRGAEPVMTVQNSGKGLTERPEFLVLLLKIWYFWHGFDILGNYWDFFFFSHLGTFWDFFRHA